MRINFYLSEKITLVDKTFFGKFKQLNKAKLQKSSPEFPKELSLIEDEKQISRLNKKFANQQQNLINQETM